MILSSLIHKNKSGQVATLTVATPAALETQKVGTVAKVATVTVANTEIEKVVIGELPNDDLFFADDRRHCAECCNLSGGRCLAAWRGEIVASRQYRPIDDLPRRCEGYAPKSNDPDQRTGKQRWPELNPLRK
ncbi:hypothetical protein V3O24_12835 [Methylobacter sp. Wu8]|uniref:hypothetical protein n=1 Tax=Methylobacter sp. Wu8 TaxID=3118457 RepID=UPI002F2E23A7